MMKKISYPTFLFLSMCITALASAQAENNTGIERDLHQDHYMRLNYGNDYFTATDFYLTQTIYFEMVLPALKDGPLYKIFYQPQNWESRHGLAIEHNAYTPVYYERPEIQYGDRPFAGSLFIKTFAMVNDPDKHQRISSSLSTGVLGPAAGAKQMQVFIHENTGNVLPQGWGNQVKNDIVLNYEVAYQKQLFAVDNILLATADGMARAGTLSTKANVGLTLMAGYFNSPFTSLKVKGRKIQLYAYDHPEINVVGYDATLQGGLFNRSSDYVISSENVNRLVFRNNWGFVARLGRVYLEYYQSFMTREFKNGIDFHNGGIQIGYTL